MPLLSPTRRGRARVSEAQLQIGIWDLATVGRILWCGGNVAMDLPGRHPGTATRASLLQAGVRCLAGSPS